MGWSQDDDKKKKKKDAGYVACSEDWEFDPILSQMEDEFDHLSEETIHKAFKSCCKEVKTPRPVDDFVDCMREKLRNK
ncbi:hypothetical protein [Desulfovibrio subterraneus]|uniref:Uncharacterized protein n=1 Tax=Desulfovibrio subterraneus TaxID=2718620 RepID=A0A7J0BHS6_9BACT|nr:hypothetical protein [Desulfovibrio subterraneus]GFM33270.1 hypothetical protein DSM101010T_16350 [Desulfovibrio subterraneus]